MLCECNTVDKLTSNLDVLGDCIQSNAVLINSALTGATCETLHGSGLSSALIICSGWVEGVRGGGGPERTQMFPSSWNSAACVPRLCLHLVSPHHPSSVQGKSLTSSRPTSQHCPLLAAPGWRGGQWRLPRKRPAAEQTAAPTGLQLPGESRAGLSTTRFSTSGIGDAHMPTGSITFSRSTSVGTKYCISIFNHHCHSPLSTGSELGQERV